MVRVGWWTSLAGALHILTAAPSNRRAGQEAVQFIGDFLPGGGVAEKSGTEWFEEENDEDFDSAEVNANREHKVYFTKEEVDQWQKNPGGAPATVSRKDPSLYRLTDLRSVEAAYRELVLTLPRKINAARDKISTRILHKNSLGYLVVVGFVLGAVFETSAFIVQAEMSVVTFMWTVVFLWGYSFGFSGPFIFTSVYGAGHGVGDPALSCSSRDFVSVLASSHFSLDLAELASRGEGEFTVMTEQLRRQLNLNLDCVLSRKEDSQVAAEVSAGVEELLQLVHLYRKLSTGSKPEPRRLAAASLATLDSALELLWGQFPALVRETQAKVRTARSYSNSVRVLVGAACGLAQVGWNMEHFTGDFMKAFETKIEAPRSSRGHDAHLKRKLTASRWDNYLPMDADQEEEMNEEGSSSRMKRSSVDIRNILVQVLALLGLNSWGSSYSLLNFLLLEPQPECGLQELAQLLDSYRELASLPRTLQVLGGQSLALHRVSEWRRGMMLQLHCLVTTEQGGLLRDTVDMWAALARKRVELTD